MPDDSFFDARYAQCAMRDSFKGCMKVIPIIGAALAALIGTSALADDMPLRGPPPACAWCGWYFGVNAGYVNSRNSLSTTAAPTPDATLGVVAGVSEGLATLSARNFSVGRSSGVIAGDQGGYNWQFGKYVAGIEADIQAFTRSGGSGTTTSTVLVVGVPVTSTQNATMSTWYLGTLRGRFGLLVTPTWLGYLTGGLAYGGVKASETLVQTGTNGFAGAGAGSLSGIGAGWALGAGLEWMVAPHWSVKAEYLHYDLTSNFYSTPTSTFFATPVYQTLASSPRFQGDLARGGVNYRF
jgi:outer membrane immunogenic protein